MSEFEKILEEVKKLANRINKECGDIPCAECPLSKQVLVYNEIQPIYKSICTLIVACK